MKDKRKDRGIKVGVYLPKALVKKIDDLIEEGKYTSRADFLKAAVREKLKIPDDSQDDSHKLAKPIPA